MLRMRAFAGLAFLGLLGLVALSWPVATAEEGLPSGFVTLATVDDDPITTKDLLELLAIQRRPSTDAPDVAYLSVDGILTRLIQNRLLEHEGYRAAADEKPEVRNQIWELVRHRGMLALLDSVTADVPEPEAAEFGPVLDRTNTIHRASHILVNGEPPARALLDSLANGAVFADLARRHSADSASAVKGGDLGWARSDLYIPEFREVLDGLAKGEVGGPVKTEKGWHLLELTDTRVETIGQSQEMKDQLREAAMRERVMARVREYVDSLKEKYGVVVNDSLLASLDYASADPEVKEELRRSDAVLTAFPWRTLTVSDLTRTIRFEHFHGLEGKPNAGVIRDQVFDDWVTELLLRHEAGELGFGEHPEIRMAAERMERELVREVVVNTILDFPFDPTPEEVAAYHAAHPEDFTRPPRIRAAGADLADAESARSFRDKVEAGARIDWLADRAPGVTDPRPARYADWILPEDLGLEASEVRAGEIVGPRELGGVWVVARIQEVETPVPAPLEECRGEVLARMKRDRMQERMTAALERLEAEATIEIASDARPTIERYLEDWLGKPVPSSGT